LGLLETSTGSLNTFTSSINTTIKNKMNSDGVISGSAQVVSALPSGTVSGSAQIIAGLPSGTVSGSVQIAIASTNGFGTYINQPLLTSSAVTFSGITNNNNAVISNNASINPSGYTNSVVVGGINTGGAWSITTGIGGNAGANQNWGMGHNGVNFYFGISNGSTAILNTWMEVSPTRTIKLDAYTTNGFVKFINTDGTLAVDTTTYYSSSSQVALTGTTGFSAYLNQALLTSSSPTFAGITSSAGITVSGTSYYTFNKPSPSGYQTVALFGTTASGLFMVSDSGIISRGAYFNGSWIATDTTGAYLNLNTSTGGMDLNVFSGGTVGNAVSPTTILTVARNNFSFNSNAILHAGNYNSYSPTLTGTGASGTWGISISGNAATASSATSASQLGGLTKSQLWNNSGNNHGTYTSFSGITDYGEWFIHQDSTVTDGPTGLSYQYYTKTVGLGNDYSYSQYAMQTAVNRYGYGTTFYTWVRYREAGTWQSWNKMAAGYADNSNISTYTTYSARVDYYPNRGDSASYPVLWGANQGTNSNTGNQSTNAFSCAAVTIQSSTGTLSSTYLTTTYNLTAGNLRVGYNAYGPDTSYYGLKHTSMASSEYMIISAGASTYISAAATQKVYLRADTNNSTYGVVVDTGSFRPETNVAMDLGSSSYRWNVVYTSDLSLSNGIGDYTIVEGENDLFLYNNKQNKVYKFMLQEVNPEDATPKR
jgi:hypothetical protein